MNATYSIDGTRLAFRDSGTGLPVVFLHPTPLDGEFWQPVTERLSGVRAIVPDLRGHGGSEMGALPTGGFALAPDLPVLTMARLAKDVLALLDHLKVHSAVFAGCSIGGYVLLEIWRQAPERVRGLAFVCSKPQPDAEGNQPRRASTIAQALAGKSAALFNGMAQTLIGATAQKQGLAIVSELRGLMTLTPQALAAVQAGLSTRPDSVPTVITITVPVLAIAGGEDPGVFPAEMDVFHDAPGGCDFHLLPDAGHFAAYEQPEKVAAFFNEWLEQLIGDNAPCANA
ncbi:MAG: alpha/beta hydrolase [Terracidiphilus sp.]